MLARMQKLKPLYTADGNIKWTTIVKRVVLKKLVIKLPYSPAIPFLGMYPRELKIYFDMKAYMLIWIATLCIIAKKVETTQLSMNRWTDKYMTCQQLNITQP